MVSFVPFDRLSDGLIGKQVLIALIFFDVYSHFHPKIPIKFFAFRLILFDQEIN